MSVRELSTSLAMNEALREEMRRDEKVFVIGEDVVLGLFGFTRGICDEFGKERVINTPISEAGFAGVGLGAAMHGMRPVVNFGLACFIYPGLDQVLCEAARTHYMFGSQVKVPITYLCFSGSVGGGGPQHSESLYPFFVQSPGLKVVLPSTAYEAKGLLKQAIREDDPVAVFVNRRCIVSSVPDDEYTIPFGVAEMRSEGNDVTIVATGHLANEAAAAADQLQEEGISAEVVNPRTLIPLDKEAILKSVAKTGRVVVADDAPKACGFAAEIAALISEECFHALKAPIKRVTRPNVVPPFSLPLERFVLPDKEKIVEAVQQLLK